MDPRFVDYHRTGDRRIRDDLLLEHLPLARRLARRYGVPAHHRDDLDQVATVGLLKALDRFDPGRGVPFVAFATPTVLGELRRHFRDHASDVRLPRDLYERSRLVRTVAEALEQDLGRPPRPVEVAARTGQAIDEVLRALDVQAAGSRTRPTDELDRHPADGEDRTVAIAEARMLLADLVRDLRPRDRLLLYLRFVEERSQRDIATRIGVSQMQVSRDLRRLVADLGARAAA